MTSVADLLAQELDRRASELRQQEQRVRRDEDDAVHKMRIVVRRVRAALASYGPVLARGATDQLREELRWLGLQLSPARDAEVVGQRLEAMVAEEPAELVMGPVVRRIRGEMAGRYRDSLERAVIALDSERYAALLTLLDGFVAAPPFGPEAGQPAATVLPRLLRRDLKRVRRRAAVAVAAESAGQRDPALHDTRKAAKRLRYAAESAVPVLGAPATALAKRARDLQDHLGEYQDTVVARDVLRELGAAAFLAHENAFTYGRLHAHEQAQAERLLAGWQTVLGRLPAKIGAFDHVRDTTGDPGDPH